MHIQLALTITNISIFIPIYIVKDFSLLSFVFCFIFYIIYTKLSF